ncbi:hypothetical protein SAMN04487970_10774 [Paenibacillus tianmuensis]|uniref:RiboL-PSP-HEPN domain-containing protein n=1 Tax=Paenibacillus tianmuensis TaxID=624147 RepID=A0A1G4TXP2_9BACL|nr:HEPN domain-containing protein [Paenibacillus tianmuensis]SCW86176.1 hypothetical protein SAMN04487970_10774 [Paenibacillus tianmuensis]
MVMGRITITNMGNEMFNDGLFYVEQAEKLENQESKFNHWRYCRAAIISFCAAAEAEIAKLIVGSLKKQSRLSPDDKRILKFLTDPNFKTKNIPTDLASISRKYNYLRKLNKLKWKSLDAKYDNLTKLRNKIIHYSFSAHDAVYSDNIFMASKDASVIVKNYIKELYTVANENPPQWVNSTASKTIV